MLTSYKNTIAYSLACNALMFKYELKDASESDIDDIFTKAKYELYRMHPELNTPQA